MSSWTSADTPSFADSSLLGQSPPFESHRGADSGTAVADLSLSELYHSDIEGVREKPFSLIPSCSNKATAIHVAEETSFFNDGRGVEAPDNRDHVISEGGKISLNEAQTREQRLQRDLFVLKKLNASLSLYNNALTDTKSSTENVSMQLERTDRLVNLYITLLQNTEKTSKIIFDETWHGGTNDLEELERIRAEAVKKAELEREELEHKAQLEAQRRIEQEQERKIREEREAKELLKKTSMPVRGVRGARGRGGSARDASASRERASVATAATGMSNKSGIPSRVSRGIRRT